MTSKDWKQENQHLVLQGRNIRDYADAHQLTVLANMESMNAEMIRRGIPAEGRLQTLRESAVFQLKSLRNSQYTLEKIQSPHLPSAGKKAGGNFDANLKEVLSGPPPKKDSNDKSKK